MKLSQLIATLTALDPNGHDPDVCIFSSEEDDNILAHAITDVHGGWWFKTEGDVICIKCDRSIDITSTQTA